MIATFSAILLSALAAQAGSFNPSRTPLQKTGNLSCQGQNPDYPSATISYNEQSDSFSITVSYDFDVLGGATGSNSWTAVGSITPTAISLTAKDRTDSVGSIQGYWNGNSYLVIIAIGAEEDKFTCFVHD